MGISAIGAALRLYNLGNNSLWLDEAWTYRYSSLGYSEIWGTMAGGEYNPPLFYWLEHLVLMFGNSETILRLLPALFGIATIFVFYLIGKEWKDERSGLVMAALLAFSPFHIFYSQEARSYTLMLLFVSLVFLFWLKNRIILVAVFASLAFWTHFYSVIPFGLMVIWRVIDGKFRGNKSLSLFYGSAVYTGLFLAFTSPLLFETTRLFLMRTSAAPNWGLKGFSLITATLTQLTMNGWTALIMTILVIIGIILTKNRWFLVSVIGGALGISLIASYFIPFHPRYLIYLLPFLLLPVTEVYSLLLSKKLPWFAVSLLLFISILIVYPNYPVKTDWRGLADYLKDAGENDTIVVAPSYLDAPFEYYYHGKSRVVYADTVAEISEVPGSYYIVTPDIYAVDSRVMIWLIENKKPFAHFNGIQVYEN